MMNTVLAFIVTAIVCLSAGLLLGLRVARTEELMRLEDEVLDIVTDTPLANQLARETGLFLLQLDWLDEEDES